MPVESAYGGAGSTATTVTLAVTPTHVVAPADIMTATDVVALAAVLDTALTPVAAVAVPGVTGAPGDGVDQAAVVVAQDGRVGAVAPHGGAAVLVEVAGGVAADAGYVPNATL
jgi:hypothetical protein